jgi:hypothetical protein
MKKSGWCERGPRVKVWPPQKIAVAGRLGDQDEAGSGSRNSTRRTVAGACDAQRWALSTSMPAA